MNAPCAVCGDVRAIARKGQCWTCYRADGEGVTASATVLRCDAVAVADCVPRSDWTADAACKTLDPQLFFAPGNVAVAARDACRSCPVRFDCLTEAIGFDPYEDQGYRGGRAPSERRRIRVMVREFRLSPASPLSPMERAQ